MYLDTFYIESIVNYGYFPVNVKFQPPGLIWIHGRCTPGVSSKYF